MKPNIILVSIMEFTLYLKLRLYLYIKKYIYFRRLCKHGSIFSDNFFAEDTVYVNSAIERDDFGGFLWDRECTACSSSQCSRHYCFK